MQKEDQNNHQKKRHQTAHIGGQSIDVFHSGQTRPAPQTGFVVDLDTRIGTGSVSVATIASNGSVGVLAGLDPVAALVPNLQAVVGIELIGIRTPPKALAGIIPDAAAGSDHDVGHVGGFEIARIVALAAVGTDLHGGIGAPETTRWSGAAILTGRHDFLCGSLEAVVGARGGCLG